MGGSSTAGRDDGLRRRSEPAADALGVGDAREAAQGVPEGGAEDVGVVGLGSEVSCWGCLWGGCWGLRAYVYERHIRGWDECQVLCYAATSEDRAEGRYQWTGGLTRRPTGF